MADKKKKEEKKPHQEKFDIYVKHADAVDKFIENIGIEYNAAIKTTLKKKGKSWVDADGNYDKKVIAKADKKILDDLTDTIMEDIIKHANPIFEKHYNTKIPDFKNNPFAKDFYERLIGINREELFKVINENKEDFSHEIYQQINQDHVSKLKSRLSKAAQEHINHEEHLEDYLNEYKIKDYFKKEALPALKVSDEGRYLLTELLSHVRKGKSPDYTFLDTTAKAYKEQTKGQIDIGKYLAEYKKVA